MKFSDGHWRIPENLSVLHPLHVHDVRVEGDEVVAEVAALEFRTRFDQINATVFTAAGCSRRRKASSASA